MSDEKSKALAAALAQIEKNFGKGSIMKMDGSQQEENLDVISTGSLGVDLALGVGGLPRGRVVEIFGPESSGKTTLCLEAIAQCQKNGGICAFIDAEHAFDPVYARKLGVKVEELYLSQPDTGEQALEICDTLVRSGGVDMVVVDSVAALVPKAEIEGEMGDSHVGLQARLMSQALRKLTGHIKRTNTLVVFINQIRMKIGVMFGSPETTTGGNALKFYASVRLDIRRSTAIKDGDTIIGNMDSQVFLGGSEPTTLKELAEALGKETIDTFNTSDTRGNSPSYGMNYQKLGKELMSRDELAVMNGSKCVLQLRGVRPFLSDKYDITQHPNYKYTSDYDKKYTFDIEKYLNRRMKLRAEDEYDVIEA